MTDEFVEQLIKEAHMRIAGIDWKVLQSGYDILDSIECKLVDENILTALKAEKEPVLRDYEARKKEIDVFKDKVKQNEERYYLELQRLKLMLKIYYKINMKL